MSQRFWLSVLIWFLSLSTLLGQADSSLVYLRFKLLNAETSEPVPYAHVLLISQSMGITSDEFGCFETPLLSNDSMIISSIGFNESRIAVADMKKDSIVNVIKLNPKIYMLSEVMVTQYPTYEQMLEAVASPIYTKTEKDIIRAYQNMDDVGLQYIARTSGKKGAGGPISAIYNMFSREQKNQRKYEQLVKEDEAETHFNKKLDVEIVKRITGLSDSSHIVQFIKFCNFDDHFLDNSSEYELYSLIVRKFKAFRREY